MRKTYRVLLCLGCAFVLAFPVLAREVTLQEALTKALRQNPDIAKAELSLAVAQSALRAAREDTFSPTISFGEEVSLFGTAQSGFSFQLKDRIFFDSSLWEEERVNLEKSERSLAATREEVKRKVITSYLEVLRMENELALAQKSVELAWERLRRLEEEYGKKETASFLLKEAQGEYKEKMAVLSDLKAQLRLCKERFFALLGEEVEGDPPFAPLPEFSFSLPEEVRLHDFVAVNDTIEDLEGRRRVLEASIANLRRAERPHVALEGTYGRSDWSLSARYDFSQRSLDILLEKSLAPLGSSKEQFGLGLVVSWDFSPTVAEEKKQLLLQKEILLLDLAVAKKDVLLNLQEQYSAVLKAWEILEGKKVRLDAQREVFASRKQQFALGVLDKIALLESELQLFTAQKEYENARYELLERFLAFLRATETPISWEVLFAPQGGGTR
ncbi:TolC family protein [Candidatus Caldatribacterium sp.]|uniref:TolC family protein n=1 Tax=Candidatus Caldatribacterium sp. TaxID=2282143 RepID=UPI0029957EE3|nr:TolC family protein [Candidatus Caldatribacterium sp.]MDW8081024.1 TolC family protein [Candidatus Calescibacterium sp.]